MSPAFERSLGRSDSKGEAKGEATRVRIAQRALELTTRVGFEVSSIGDLARDPGLSKSGLSADFGFEEQQVDVLHAAAELFEEAVFDPVLRAAQGEARVVALSENGSRVDPVVGAARGVRINGRCLRVR